jgi:hypothetical protein
MRLESKTYRRLPHLIVLLWAACAGCQAWRPGGEMPLSRNQREILSKVDSDPFPTPADVGLSVSP